MATIKSYTDLPQSKVIAEFLPHESADMTYRPIMDIDSMSNSGFLNTPECYPFNEFKNSTIKPLPCWSLAALLNVLPKRYYDDNVYMPLVGRYYEGNHKFICGYFGDGLFDYTFGETSVDACVAMIIKLHELKLL